MLLRALSVAPRSSLGKGSPPGRWDPPRSLPLRMCRGLRFRSLPTTVLTTSVSGSGKGRGGGRVWGNPQAERSVSAAMSTPGSVAPEVAFDPATPPVVEGFSPTPHRLRDESVKDKFQRKVVWPQLEPYVMDSTAFTKATARNPS
uniref:HIG1 domain family member 2A, mitochondrial isoform X2 n=1 Tax=Phascolarctos cinereus TaxID=38626 RepID=A0A6P5L8L5_PHACI|nr:HIG1 domain family member 2A, mitochondrial isoform X2 [Phascolarctos cinereus]